MGIICIILKLFECSTGSNMDLYINNNHILYYHMDVAKSSMLGHSYFINPHNLVSTGGPELQLSLHLEPY